jgi:hypothetical protein
MLNVTNLPLVEVTRTPADAPYLGLVTVAFDNGTTVRSQGSFIDGKLALTAHGLEPDPARTVSNILSLTIEFPFTGQVVTIAGDVASRVLLHPDWRVWPDGRAAVRFGAIDQALIDLGGLGVSGVPSFHPYEGTTLYGQTVSVFSYGPGGAFDRYRVFGEELIARTVQVDNLGDCRIGILYG